MNEEISTDIIIETLEVFTNHILCVREIYPPQIFRKRKIYNCPVFVSIYPPVNNYINEVLSTARQLKTSKQLQKVEILIYRNEKYIYEKYGFDISDDCPIITARNGEDEYLLEFEQQLRTSLCTLSERVKSLRKLPKDAKFKMQLYTSQTGFVKTCCGPKYEEFPWLQVTISNDNDFKEVALLPLSTIGTTGIKINAEI